MSTTRPALAGSTQNKQSGSARQCRKARREKAAMYLQRTADKTRSGYSASPKIPSNWIGLRSVNRRSVINPGDRANLADAVLSVLLCVGLGFEKQPGALAVFVSESRDTPRAGLREGIRPDLQATYLRNRQMSKLFRVPKSQKVDPRRASIECQCLANYRTSARD
jgi:hypothetical protein